MILAQDYEEVLKDLGKKYFIFTLHYVRNLKSWAGEKKVDLSEPSQPMKLTIQGNRFIMLVQSEIDEEMLDDVAKALSVRWSLKDNVSDPSDRLNSIKKKLAYCFLKEYARTINDIAGDDLIEDEWAMKEMERLGFFRE